MGESKSLGSLILKGRLTVIMLFQGAFDKNTLTLCPGWNKSAAELETSTDVSEI